MDFSLLDSIIECSVCLERLKQDARVLPCQHTFCLDCLKRVANKNPQTPIACPECRQQTNIYDINLLPKNVFLIRLLDQIKQKANGSPDVKDEEISTPITTTNSSDKTKVVSTGVSQSKPQQNEVKQHQQTSVPHAKALYDFQMNPLEDEGCLKFQKGMIIQVTRRVDQNWAEGKLGESVGIFPLSFVNMNQAATSLMQSYATKWRLPASMPSTSNYEQAPTTSTNPLRQIPVLQPTPAHPYLIRPTSPSNNNINQNKSNVLQDKSGIYIALHNYTPQKPDELELKKGLQYIVKEACQDGWLKGCCSDNLFRKGVFPGNYVMPLAYHQKLMSAQRNSNFQTQKNQTNLNTQQMRTTGAYTNLGLSSIPPELPQRNVIPSSRTSHSPLAHTNNTPESMASETTTAQTQKTDDNLNKLNKKETVTEMLMKKLGYTRKSNDSSVYSMDNPVFEDSTTTSKVGSSNQLFYNHNRSGSCPIDLGISNSDIENLQTNSDTKSNAIVTKRHSINLSGPSSTTKHIQNTQIKTQHRKSSSLDTTSLEPNNSTTQMARYRCVTKYPANSRFELSLNVGDIVILQKKRDNGWYKGELTRTGQVGLFPANFVELVENN
ncbi:CLUMA_CG005732, isoform A [Clunio marinus]|uniref:CLUMA_CG005732, isoform A n=1 Tax=Clunio marinus TaxID=568069 RepID=A0A1J1HVU8_9DIPT|nr:CLUMA_CG005732, isoform A [Clunio marinus]